MRQNDGSDSKTYALTLTTRIADFARTLPVAVSVRTSCTPILPNPSAEMSVTADAASGMGAGTRSADWVMGGSPEWLLLHRKNAADSCWDRIPPWKHELFVTLFTCNPLTDEILLGRDFLLTTGTGAAPLALRKVEGVHVEVRYHFQRNVAILQRCQ